jgi:plastocyanin domain-containing protein
MLVFSLGTMPALMSLSALTSFAKGNFLRYFVKTAGVVVVLLGLLNINNGLALAGVSVDFSAFLPKNQETEELSGVTISNGKQIADMKVVGYEYYPSRFTVEAGTPVEWRIDGTKAAGCAQVITMPKMRLTRRLSRSGITTISFTPQSAGTLEFSCTMGMTTRGAKFAVSGKGTGSAQRPARVQGDDPIDYSKCDPRYAMCL